MPGSNTVSAEDAKAARYRMMTETPVKQLILKLSVPTIISFIRSCSLFTLE